MESMPDRAGRCAANVAIDFAKQGIVVGVAGCVGDDSAAQVILDSCDVPVLFTPVLENAHRSDAARILAAAKALQ
jgi:sugar/nucleoside kinase (ribokinase family)